MIFILLLHYYRYFTEVKRLDITNFKLLVYIQLALDSRSEQKLEKETRLPLPRAFVSQV